MGLSTNISTGIETSNNLAGTSQPIYNGNHSVYNSWQAFPDVDYPIQSISKLQMRSALNYFNVLKKFEDAVEVCTPEIKQYWLSAFEFNRDDEFLIEMAKKLQLTNRQVDFIFEMGATL
jgi:hypothetical protein